MIKLIKDSIAEKCQDNRFDNNFLHVIPKPR